MPPPPWLIAPTFRGAANGPPHTCLCRTSLTAVALAAAREVRPSPFTKFSDVMPQQILAVSCLYVIHTYPGVSLVSTMCVQAGTHASTSTLLQRASQTRPATTTLLSTRLAMLVTRSVWHPVMCMLCSPHLLESMSDCMRRQKVQLSLTCCLLLAVLHVLARDWLRAPDDLRPPGEHSWPLFQPFPMPKTKCNINLATAQCSYSCCMCSCPRQDSHCVELCRDSVW